MVFLPEAPILLCCRLQPRTNRSPFSRLAMEDPSRTRNLSRILHLATFKKLAGAQGQTLCSCTPPQSPAASRKHRASPARFPAHGFHRAGSLRRGYKGVGKKKSLSLLGSEEGRGRKEGRMWWVAD